MISLDEKYFYSFLKTLDIKYEIYKDIDIKIITTIPLEKKKFIIINPQEKYINLLDLPHILLINFEEDRKKINFTYEKVCEELHKKYFLDINLKEFLKYFPKPIEEEVYFLMIKFVNKNIPIAKKNIINIQNTVTAFRYYENIVYYSILGKKTNILLGVYNKNKYFFFLNYLLYLEEVYSFRNPKIGEIAVFPFILDKVMNY
ncbi:hypothetical protein AB836_00055 [Rickettsiales bacterium (ex Bugula neritina AB1)]|nr:hypothetical protein AB836_00055 [Rickettsiales bacterium (ex Bugula neritina AB1)]